MGVRWWRRNPCGIILADVDIGINQYRVGGGVFFLACRQDEGQEKDEEEGGNG